MTSKIALGAAGLALAGGLGRMPAFASNAFPILAETIALACLVTTLFALPRLTERRARPLPAA